MKHCRIIPGCLLLTILVSCGGNSERDRLHKAAFEMQQEVIEQIEEVEEMITSLSTQKKDSLNHLLHQLEESLFPIPGYELELPGHEGHDHGHNRVELTAEEILEVQKELIQQLNHVKSDLANDK